MAWLPNDLVTDLDLLAYEGSILSSFGKVDWADKRRKAANDILVPLLKSQGFQPERFRTRYEPNAVVSYISSAYADVTGAATSTSTDDLNLAAIFATANGNALYIGSDQQFRGISVRMLEAVTSVANVASVAYWADAWVTTPVTDRTKGTSGKSFSQGGAITWGLPNDWVVRPLETFDRRYWVKLTTTATPTGALAGQLGVIRHSVLSAPLTFWTLMLIFLEAPTSSRGPWDKKAQEYRELATDAWTRALPSLGGEFESDDPPTDQISAEEAAQTTAEVTGGPWRLERA